MKLKLKQIDRNNKNFEEIQRYGVKENEKNKQIFIEKN